MRPADLIRIAEARTREYRKPGVPLDCPSGQSKKSTKRGRRGPYREHRPVEEEEVAEVQALPYATAREVADALGMEVGRVRYIRKRYGRGWDRASEICVVCDQRHVWDESAQARSMHLCKACYLAEMRRRDEEERESAAVRQMRKRTRDGRGRGGHQR